MSARRLLKAGEAIREVVAMAILTEIRDPRVKNITVIGVEVAPDMREAKVLISIMGSESQQATSLRGLKNSAGFLQAKIAERIDTRYTPKLTFVADEGVKKSLAVAQILDQIALEKQQSESVTDSTRLTSEASDTLGLPSVPAETTRLPDEEAESLGLSTDDATEAPVHPIEQ